MSLSAAHVGEPRESAEPSGSHGSHLHPCATWSTSLGPGDLNLWPSDATAWFDPKRNLELSPVLPTPHSLGKSKKRTGGSY